MKVISVWVLISVHKTDSTIQPKIKRMSSRDEMESEDYDVYTNCFIFNDTNGERIHGYRTPDIAGSYTNDPVNLIRFDIDPKTLSQESGTVGLTLVMTQIRKSSDISYTLSVFSTRPFILSRTPPLPMHQIKIKSAWEEGNFQNSGGPLWSHKFDTNPLYRLVVTKSPAHVHLQMFYPSKVQASIFVFSCGTLVPNSHVVPYSLSTSLFSSFPTIFFCYLCTSSVPTPIHITRPQQVPDSTGKLVFDREIDDKSAAVMKSEKYSYGFCCCSKLLQPGGYNVVFSKYHEDMTGNIVGICASSTPSISLIPIPPEGEGFFKKVVNASWEPDVTAVGCSNLGKYLDNPMYRLDILNTQQQPIVISARLRLDESTPPVPMNISIYSIVGEPISDTQTCHGIPVLRSTHPKRALLTSNKGVYVDSRSVRIPPSTIECTAETRAMSLAIIPSLFDQTASMFSLEVYVNISESGWRLHRVR